MAGKKDGFGVGGWRKRVPADLPDVRGARSIGASALINRPGEAARRAAASDVFARAGFVLDPRTVMRCNAATPEYALSPSMEETSPGCMPEHASYSSLALAAGRKDGFSRTGAATCWIISMVSPTETRFCRDIWQIYIP
jgi:hypothetical protein